MYYKHNAYDDDNELHRIKIGCPSLFNSPYHPYRSS